MKSIFWYLAALGLLVLVGTLWSCTSTGYQQADKVSGEFESFQKSVSDSKDDLEETYALIASLQGTVAQDPEKALNSYRRSVDMLQSSLKTLEQRRDMSMSSSEDYFKQWSAQLSEITNPELSKASRERKEEQEIIVSRVWLQMEQVKTDFSSLLVDLTDLRTFLEQDLSAASVAAGSSMLMATETVAVELQASLDLLIAEIQAVIVEMTPENA